MTDHITIPADQPDASFGKSGERFYGIYRLPHGKWRDLVGANKERLFFSTSQEATRAAMAKVCSLLFRPIRADQGEEADPFAAKLAADVATFRSRKNERLIRRGGGRRPVVVETKRGG